MKTLHWFREDLRLYDNQALSHAADGGDLVTVFIFPDNLGAASYWWLHHSLTSLQIDLAKHGVELVLHGHSHRSSLSQIDTRRGRTPVIGVPSASAIGVRRGRRAQYHIYQVTKHAESWTVRLDVRGYSPGDERFISEGGNEFGMGLNNA